MRFSAVASLALVGAAAAREMSLKQRQVQTIVDVLNNINGLVGTLDGTINAWSSGSPQPVLDASAAIISATQKGADTINGAAVITVNDAIQVQKVVQTLTASVNKAVGDLVAKKSQASAAQLGGEAYKQLKLQYDGAKAVSTAVSSKVPQTLQTVANNLAGAILAGIQKGIDAYSDIQSQVYPGALTAATGSTATAAGAASGSSNGTAPVASHAPTSASGTTTTASTSAAAAPAASASKAASASAIKAAGSFSVFAAVLAVFAL